MAILDLFRKKRGRPKKQAEHLAETDTYQSLTAKDWLEKIRRAKEVRKKWAEDQRIDLALKYYEGTQRPSHLTEEEWITVNLIYSTIQAELPILYAGDPEFNISLKKSFQPDPTQIAEYEEVGKIRAAYLNYLAGELELKDKARQAIFDALFSYGIIKVHTTVTEVKNPYAGQVMQVEGQDMTDPETGEPVMEPEKIVTDVKYHITRIHPSDFLVDEDAGPIYCAYDGDVSWVAHRIKKTLAEVKADPRYQNIKDSIVGTETSDDLQDREANRKPTGLLRTVFNKDKQADIVVLWEVWDIDNGVVLTVAEGNDNDFVRSPAQYPAGIEVPPFAALRFTRRDDSWYPLSQMGVLVDSQREYCEIRSYQLRHRKNVSGRVYTVDASAFDNPQNAMEQLASGEDGTGILHERNTGFPPINLVQNAPLDQAINIELAYLKQDFSELAVGSNQRGGGAGVDSATEAGIIAQRAGVREADRKQLVAEFLGTIGRLLDQQIQATMTDDLAVKVAGPRGEYWQVIKASNYEDIAGEFAYTVTVGSAIPYLPEIERAQTIQFLSMLATFPQLLMAPATTKRLAEQFGLRNEAIVEELLQLGQQMMSGALPAPGNGASQPGVPESQPMNAMQGAGAGINNIRGGQQ